MRFLPHYSVKTTDIVALETSITAYCVSLYQKKLEALFLYGSYAAGNPRPESDIDILIVIQDSDKRLRDRLRAFSHPPKYSGPEINPVILTTREFLGFPPITLSLLAACVVWYPKQQADGGEDRASYLLNALKTYAREKHISKVNFRSHYYWKTDG